MRGRGFFDGIRALAGRWPASVIARIKGPRGLIGALLAKSRKMWRLAAAVASRHPKIQVGERRILHAKQEDGTLRYQVQIAVVPPVYRTLEKCRAHLTAVSKLAADGSWRQTFEGSRPLWWSKPGVTIVDIPPGSRHFLSIMSADEGINELFLRCETSPLPDLPADRVTRDSSYRFAFSITAENAAAPCHAVMSVRIAQKGMPKIQIDWVPPAEFV